MCWACIFITWFKKSERNSNFKQQCFEKWRFTHDLNASSSGIILTRPNLTIFENGTRNEGQTCDISQSRNENTTGHS